jgi:polyisoprenoid-binding protein YceI
MKKALIVCSCFFLLCGMKFFLPQEWKLNKEKAVVKYVLPMSKADSGKFTGIEAKLNFDPLDLSKSSLTGSVAVNTLSTGDDSKDAQLKSAEFFDAEKYPKITFTSSKITAVKNGFMAEGKLEIKKIVKKINFPFTFTKTGDGGIFSGSFEIFSGDYTVMKKSKSGSDKVKITIEIPVTK